MPDLQQEATLTIGIKTAGSLAPGGASSGGKPPGGGLPAAPPGAPDPSNLGQKAKTAFDAAGEALKRIEAEARAAAVEAHYRALKGLPPAGARAAPPPFDPAGVAAERIAREQKARAIEDEYRKQKGLPPPLPGADDNSPEAAAKRKMNAEAHAKETDLAYRKLRGLPAEDRPPPFDPAGAAQKQVAGQQQAGQVEAAAGALRLGRLLGLVPGLGGMAGNAAAAAGQAGDPRLGALLTAADDLRRAFQGITGAAQLADYVIRNELTYSAKMLAGGNIVAAESERSKGRYEGAGTGIKGAGAVLAGGLAATGFGLPAAAVALIGSQIIGSLVGGMGSLANVAADSFVQRGEAMRGFSQGRLARFSPTLAGAQGQQRMQQLGRDIAEGQASGPELAALTRSESEFNRVQQAIQAVKRQGEAIALQKETKAETEKLRKELTGLMKDANALTRQMVERMLADKPNPLDAMLKRAKLGEDHRPFLDAANRLQRDGVPHGPFFGGGK